jgi:lipopolysaccharide biosynthesis glycosyltransferase
VFNQDKYVDMLFLLLESLFTWGNLNDHTEVLIYTSTPFRERIQQSQWNHDKIKFEVNDTYNSVDAACKSRLDVFYLPSIANYEKILYLDTDILVTDNINKIFDVVKDDVLYVLEEGTIDDSGDCWGKSLFGNEVHQYSDKSAFTSGILAFNNCAKIQLLFDNILNDIQTRPRHFSCFDQPYIVYNAFKYNLYNNKLFKAFVVNEMVYSRNDKVIHHFAGGPGVYQHKIVHMMEYLKRMKWEQNNHS